MNRRVIIILALIMAATSIWFVFFQIKWIHGAMEVKEHHFVDNVKLSLDEFVSNLERDEVVQIITNQSTYVSDDSLNVTTNTDSSDALVDINANNFIFLKPDSSNSISSTNPLVVDDAKQLNQPFNNQTYFVYEIINELTKKRINNKERFDTTKIKLFLDKALNQNEIHEEYEFAIVDEDKNYLYSSNSFDLNSSDEIFTKQLYPNDLFSQKKIYIMLYFIDEDRKMLKELSKIVITSLFLSLIIISLFAVTLYIISKQKKLSELKNNFVNNMTHELKTPISTISLASQMLKDESIPQDTKDIPMLSNMISQETERLGFQVEKILQMAIIEKGKLKFQLDFIKTHDVLTKISKSFELKINAKLGKIKLDFKAEKEIIYVDKLHFSNVIYNLIDNALKYCEEEPYIKINTYNKNGLMVISVSDNGIGISKEHVKNIFQQFYRVPTGDLHNVKGFGLGLSYVQRIVEEFKGQIKVNSVLTKGTTFYIYLPLVDEKMQ